MLEATPPTSGEPPRPAAEGGPVEPCWRAALPPASATDRRSLRYRAPAASSDLSCASISDAEAHRTRRAGVRIGRGQSRPAASSNAGSNSYHWRRTGGRRSVHGDDAVERRDGSAERARLHRSSAAGSFRTISAPGGGTSQRDGAITTSGVTTRGSVSSCRRCAIDGSSSRRPASQTRHPSSASGYPATARPRPPGRSRPIGGRVKIT